MAIVRKTLEDLQAKPFAFSAEQRARHQASSDEEIERRALQDDDNQPWTDEQLDRAVIARRIRRMREKLHLSQTEFAERYHIPVATLREWEQARRRPARSMLAYITVIEREPDAVSRALL